MVSGSAVAIGRHFRYDRGVPTDDRPEAHEVVISPARWRNDRRLLEALREGLEACPDVAFAHLAEAQVPSVQSQSEPALFVWVTPPALRSLRSALNLVSEAVARALPEDRYVDIVILNSAPELLDRVEAVATLVAERDPEERSRALSALENLDGYLAMAPRRRWWWPF